MKKTAWYIVLFANWALIAFFWWRGSGSLLADGMPFILISLGRLAGLAAAYMILQQFFFMGRTPWLERVFGLDTLSRLHHKNGQWGFLLLLFHPFLLVFGYAAATAVPLADQLKKFLFDTPYVGWAAIGLALFIVVVATSISIVRNKYRYESWYFVHLAAYAAVFAAYFHQVTIGEDILASRLFYGYWIFLYAFVGLNHVVFRFVRPICNFFQHRFFVSAVERENYNTVSIRIKGNKIDKFNVCPGQFMIVRFLTKGLWLEAHPFSLSRAPDGRELRITVKELGDFTRRIGAVPVGTKVFIDGPYGVFTELFAMSQKILLIAGGIGITPIRSLAEDMGRHGKDVVVLYSNKTENDIVFKEELNSISGPNVRVTHVLSDEPAYSGETGRIDKEKIARLVPDVAKRDIYLCGPVPMMDALAAALRELSVPGSRIHFEKFSL